MQVTIIRDSMEPEQQQVFMVDNLIPFLVEHFDNEWPETAKIYHGPVALENDVTPTCEEDIETLAALDGEFTVIVYPGAFVAIAVGLALVAIAATFVLKKKPNITTSVANNSDAGSSNNSLSDRSNKARPNERIPDIFGTVNAVPDLISRTYFTYINNNQVEHAYMCIGRGTYAIGPIRDDQTLIGQINGSSVEVYGPDTSPNSGDAPQVRIGNPIGDKVRSVIESNAVSGQTLLAPNGRFFNGQGNMAISTDGVIYTSDPKVNFAELFGPGDVISFTNATFTYTYTVTGTDPDTGQPVSSTASAVGNMSGSYAVNVVETPKRIRLTDTYLNNPDWALFKARNGVLSAYDDADVTGAGNYWVGPFLVELPGMNEIITNFVAPNGLYKSDGQSYFSADIAVEIEVTPVDANNYATGPTQTYQAGLYGSAIIRSQRAVTLQQLIPECDRVLIRARRITNTDTTAPQVQDEVVWANLYGSRIVPNIHFGNVTTVLSLTQANDSSTAINSRKLNMLVTRFVNSIDSNENLLPNMIPSERASDILLTVCLDKYIGNRRLEEIDIHNIYTTMNSIGDYFGCDYARRFCYTFDDTGVSFEETVATIADAVFCTAYRQGLQIRLFFEKLTEDSTLLFNHRNKLPNSETRTVNFGTEDDYDGIEFTYVDPGDEATITLFAPADRSATKPKQVKGVGIRNNVQAHFHIMRLYNKLKYQNVSVEFTGTAESRLLVLNERILVADNTRSGTQDGEIVGQSGLVVETSQPVVFTVGKQYSMFIQYADGSVDSIGVTAGSDARHVVLANAPQQALSIDPNNYARTGYIIVANDDTSQRAFLVASNVPDDNYTSKLTAINYSDRYYYQDFDYINGLITYQDYADNS